MIATTLADIRTWKTAVGSFVAGHRVLIIVDPAVEAAFAINETLNCLGATSVTPFIEFTPNPTWESLSAAVTAAQSSKIDRVVAIGGGTAIDLAKLTAMALTLGSIDAMWQAQQAGDDLRRQDSAIRLMAVPTTAGTGAEATRFAVLYREGIKYSIAGDGLKPDVCTLDPSLLTSLPPSVVADAGLDAACQAMESLWSVRCDANSEQAAWAALDLAIKHLEPAVQTGDEASLAGMLVAANLAGKAINFTTTTAPHALSYGLTSMLGTPHGRVVALLFGEVYNRTAELNSDTCTHLRGLDFVRRRLDEIATRWGQTRDSFPHWWSRYLRERLCIRPLNAALEALQFDQLTTSVNATRLANHPRTFTSQEIHEIYQSLFESNPDIDS